MPLTNSYDKFPQQLEVGITIDSEPCIYVTAPIDPESNVMYPIHTTDIQRVSLNEVLLEFCQFYQYSESEINPLLNQLKTMIKDIEATIKVKNNKYLT